MATSEDLSNWLNEHYRYELLMLRYTHQRVHRASDQLEWNAYFESCAMHARNLRDFYCNKGQSNSRKASAYGAADIAKAGEESGAFVKINEQIDHPSTNRAFSVEDGKLTIDRLDEIVAWLEKKHRLFIAKCETSLKDGWVESSACPPPVLIVSDNTLASATNQFSSLDGVGIVT
jgi:hypothetical protein